MCATTLNIADLHELYASVTPEEAIAIANLGALCWQTCKQELYDQWSSSMSVEDRQKAEAWKQEGRMAALESLKEKLIAAEEAMMRTIKAEGQMAFMKTEGDREVAEKVEKAVEQAERDLELRMKDLEIEKMREMSELREQVAVLKSQNQIINLLQESNGLLNSRLESLVSQMTEKEAEIESFRESQQPKSSHAIGKQGEASIQELLEGPIMDEFPYSTVKNMSGVIHAADFHVHIMTETGKRKKFLIDSKKYIQPVNSREVTKLNNDVDGDEEADGGILISIGSPISKKKQFQIMRTTKNKPVIYLTFLDLDVDQQKELLCWALRALVQIVGEVDMRARDSLLDNIDRFLEEVNTSVKEMDKAIACQSRAVDVMRQVRTDLLKKLVAFKKSSDPSEPQQEQSVVSTKSESGAGEVFIIDESESVERRQSPQSERCSVFFRSSGLQCNKMVVEGCKKCKAHLGRRK